MFLSPSGFLRNKRPKIQELTPILIRTRFLSLRTSHKDHQASAVSLYDHPSCGSGSPACLPNIVRTGVGVPLPGHVEGLACECVPCKRAGLERVSPQAPPKTFNTYQKFLGRGLGKHFIQEGFPQYLLVESELRLEALTVVVRLF